MLHKQSANQAVSQTYFFFPSQIFLLHNLRKNFWLLIVLVHMLRIVGKLKCLCSGLQHSQSSLSYERNASSEWTLDPWDNALAKGCSYTLKMNHSSLLYPRTTILPLIMCTTWIIFQPHSYLLLVQEPETQRRQRPHAVAVGSAVVPSRPASSPRHMESPGASRF